MAQQKTTILYIKPADRVAALKDQQRKIERLMVGITLVIFGGIAMFLLIPSEALESTTAWISRLENGGTVSRNVATNCLDPRNRNTAYCLDRAAAVESDWRSITRFSNGKSNQFTLSGR